MADSADPDCLPHRILYREDFFASALHEVSHWCLTGRRRRALEDYGYWNAADGRSTAEQREFEKVEARPQAIEWILSDACDFQFQLSADNLESGIDASARLESAVRSEKSRIFEVGLPPRAEKFRVALVRGVSSGRLG